MATTGDECDERRGLHRWLRCGGVMIAAAACFGAALSRGGISARCRLQGRLELYSFGAWRAVRES